MRRAALMLVLAAACAPKHARPAPDVELYRAVTADPGHGLLIFRNPSPVAQPRHWLARQTVEGRTTWHRPVPARNLLDLEGRIDILGGSALIPTSAGNTLPATSLLHVRLADGAMTEWAPGRPATIRHEQPPQVIGDDRQIFVAWRHPPAERPILERPNTGHTSLELSAFDPISGERTWTFVDDIPDWRTALLHLTDDLLLFADSGVDWSALDRTTGARAPFPIADIDSAVCSAAGRLWARRDDHLLTIDAATDHVHAEPATFIPAERRHQWSLSDCSATDDREVILAVNLDRFDGGLLVAVDRDTAAPLWSLALPVGFPRVNSEERPATWPRRVGDTVFIDQHGHTCAVSREARGLLWCTRWKTIDSYVDGDDLILHGHPVADERQDATDFVRIRGADAQVVAAASLHTTPPFRDATPSAVLGDAHLWISLTEPDPFRPEELPLLVLDARTLRRVPHAAGRLADVDVRDAMPEIDTIFPRTTDPLPPLIDHDHDYDYQRSIRQAVNPWDVVFLGNTNLVPADHTPTDHTRGLAEALADAGLPPGTPIRVLAACDRLVVASAQRTIHDVTRTTLLKVTHYSESDFFTHTQSFTRPLTATDLDRFLLTDRYNVFDDAPTACDAPGTLDEAAWAALTPDPRTQTWLLR